MNNVEQERQPRRKIAIKRKKITRWSHVVNHAGETKMTTETKKMTGEQIWFQICMGRLAIRKMIKNKQLTENALLDEEFAFKLGEYVDEVRQ